jgi:beta-xylosidase/AraC-like DNA-binding protein
MREIMEFSFARNGESNTHLHQDLEILYLLRGTAKVIVSEESYLLKMNDYILINANKRHSIENLELTTVFARFTIDFSLMTEYLGTNQILFWCNSVVDKHEAYASLRRILDQILNLFFEEAEEEQFRLRSLYYNVIYLLVSNFMVKTKDLRIQKLGFLKDTRVFEIQNYVQANFQKQLSLNDLSRQLYLSAAYLSKYIKKQFGMSFVDYVNNVRLFHAVEELIYTNKKVTRIAVDNGFPATASFNKAFKDCFQVTPSQYRTSHAKIKNITDGENCGLSEEALEEIKQLLKQKNLPIEKKKSRAVHAFTLDANHRRTFKKPWSEVINVGEAALLLRSDIQEHLLTIREELNFSKVRIWNIFSLIIYQNAERYLNYNKLDRIFDFLVGNKMQPYIDLGFKPKIVIKSMDQNVMEQESEILFTSLQRYEEVLKELAAHLVNRYGLELLESWYFELWNDARLQIGKTDGRYYEIFDAGYRILKRYSSKIKIGGAGFILGYENHLFEKVLSIWKQHNIQPDFLSVYSYGYVMIQQEGILYGKKSLDSQYMINQIEVIRQISQMAGVKEKEIFVSEWNFTISNRNVLNDSCWKAAYLIKNCIDAVDKIDLLAYWHATDLISEHYDTEAIINGDGGLLSKEGIRKPAYFSFRFLASLQPYLLGKDEFSIITSNGRGNYTIVCHNYKKLTYQYAMKEEDLIEIEQKDSFVEDLFSIRLQFQLCDVDEGEYLIKSYYINQKNGSVQDIWEEMGYQKHLSVFELEYIKKMASPHMEMHKEKSVKRCLEIEAVLEPHEIRMIEIQYQY